MRVSIENILNAFLKVKQYLFFTNTMNYYFSYVIELFGSCTISVIQQICYKNVKLGVLCITFPFFFIIVAAYDFEGCTSRFWYGSTFSQTLISLN